MSNSNGQNTGDKVISKLLNEKRKFENSFERKQRIWEKTEREHIELEKVDVKLQELNYDFCSN